MSVALVTLTSQLERAVPQRSGVPADYMRLARDAVLQLSTDVPIITTTLISVVAGQASYALPPDFLFEIELLTFATVGNTIVSGAQLVPLGAGWEEQHYIEGATLRFEPTPAYTLARTLRYAAAHVLADGSYPRLTENGARIALLYGQHLALTEQAAAVAGDGWMYVIGDETVNKSGQGAAIRAQAEAALVAYQNAVKPLKGYGRQYRANPYTVGDV